MEITGGELLARTLDHAGLREVFTLHGGHLDAFLVSCEKYGINLTDTRNESTAGHAADAYARLTGRPGVCVTTSGPGFTNTLTAIVNAYLDSIPVLFIVGAPPLREVETNPLQGGFDQIAMATPATKWAHRVTDGERIPELVALALRTAVSGRPGPVLLEIPIDVMFGPIYGEIRMPRIELESPRTAPTTTQVEAILDLLAGAKRPVLVAGGGAMLARAGAELVELAEKTSIPVYLPNKGGGLVPSDHPLYGGGAATLGALMMGQAPDVVILVGQRQGLFTGGRHGYLEGASVVQIDREYAEIGRMNDVAIGVTADARETLAALARAVDDRRLPDFGEWARTATAPRQGHAQLWPGVETASGRMHPYHAAREVMAALPDRTVVALDGGEAASWAALHVDAREVDSVVQLGYLGCLGVGQGFGIGAHRANPDRPILLFTGDGAFAFQMADIEPMTRHDIPVVTVVFNNAVWGMSIHGQQAVYGDAGTVVSRLATSSYEKVAEAFGGYGERVDRLEEVGPAVRRAFESGKPAVLNLVVDADVVHPVTPSMLGDVHDEDSIVIPYYENVPKR